MDRLSPLFNFTIGSKEDMENEKINLELRAILGDSWSKAATLSLSQKEAIKALALRGLSIEKCIEICQSDLSPNFIIHNAHLFSA